MFEVFSGFDGGIVGEELEDGREVVSIRAVIKELVTQGYVRQEGGGVVDLLNSKSHHLEAMITSQMQWLSGKKRGDGERKFFCKMHLPYSSLGIFSDILFFTICENVKL